MSWICFEIKEKMKGHKTLITVETEIGMVEFGTLVYIFTCLEICLITKSKYGRVWKTNEKRGEMM